MLTTEGADVFFDISMAFFTVVGIRVQHFAAVGAWHFAYRLTAGSAVHGLRLIDGATVWTWESLCSQLLLLLDLLHVWYSGLNLSIAGCLVRSFSHCSAQ